MKILTTILRVLFVLLLLMPVLGTLGVFPAPTADMYSPAGWAFMEALMNTGYMMPLMGLTCAVALLFLLVNRTALAAVILAPFTVNVVLFHVVLGGDFFTPAAIPAWLLLVFNVYFLWVNRAKYTDLL